MPKSIFLFRNVFFIFSGLFLSLLLSTPISAQYQTFDSNFNYIASQLNVTDNDLAFTQAEALLNSAQTKEQQLKALMLLATLNNDKGNYAQAINTASIALQEATALADTNWLMRINGFLSSNYRSIYLFQKGKVHLLALKELMKDIGVSPVVKGLTAQESSYYLIEERKYLDAINELQQAKINLKHEKNQALNDYYQSTNYFMLGNCFLKMKDYKLAKENYKQSLSLSNDHNNISTGLCLVGLAEIAMFENEYDQANEYLIKATKLAVHSKQYELKLGIANLYAAYHEKMENHKEALEYRNEYIKLTNEKLESIKVVNNQLQTPNDPLTQISQNKTKQRIPCHHIMFGYYS